MEEKKLLDVQNISKKFGDVHVLSNISFHIFPGKIHVLLGPNGAGKSTILSICEGLLAPDEGSVYFDGNQVEVRNNSHNLVNMGIMLQNNGGYPTARVEEILSLFSSFYAHPLDMNWLLELVGLTHVRKTTYKHLSGGQQQRLSLACALIGKPRLLFLDEPSAGLDFEGQKLIVSLIKALSRDGVAIVLTTHSMWEVEHLADYVLVLSKGKIITSGTAHEVLSPTGNDTLVFKLSSPVDEKLLHTLFAGLSVSTTDSGGYRITGEITPAIVHKLTSFALEHNVLLSDMTVGHNNLDHILALVHEDNKELIL